MESVTVSCTVKFIQHLELCWQPEVACYTYSSDTIAFFSLVVGCSGKAHFRLTVGCNRKAQFGQISSRLPLYWELLLRISSRYTGKAILDWQQVVLKPKDSVRVMVGLDTSAMALYNTDENHQSTSDIFKGIKLTNKLQQYVHLAQRVVTFITCNSYKTIGTRFESLLDSFGFIGCFHETLPVFIPELQSQ